MILTEMTFLIFLSIAESVANVLRKMTIKTLSRKNLAIKCFAQNYVCFHPIAILNVVLCCSLILMFNVILNQFYF